MKKKQLPVEKDGIIFLKADAIVKHLINIFMPSTRTKSFFSSFIVIDVMRMLKLSMKAVYEAVHELFLVIDIRPQSNVRTRMLLTSSSRRIICISRCFCWLVLLQVSANLIHKPRFQKCVCLASFLFSFVIF